MNSNTPKPGWTWTRNRARRGVVSLTAVAGLLIAASVSVLSAGTAAAAPGDLTTSAGSIGDDQSLDALTERDQYGGDDDWDSYIEFEPADDGVHESLFRLSPEGNGNGSLEIDLNFRGPDADENRWELKIRNQALNRWVSVFVNTDVPDWEWSEGYKEFFGANQYVDSNGKARFQFRSSNDTDVAQLDFVGLTIVDNGPPTVTSTTISTTTIPTVPPTTGPQVVLPQANAGFDYQISADYQIPAEVTMVSRDWFVGSAEAEYNVCYVNAFQTQDDEPGVDRPDEKSNWPRSLVLTDQEDPNWDGEFMINIDTPTLRQAALQHLKPMIATCAAKNFDAVEYDNLDSWTRLDSLPFDQDDTVAFATMLTDEAHRLGLAVAQKNTSELIENNRYRGIGFDFAIAEECGRYDECGTYRRAYGDRVFIIEYNDQRPNPLAAFNKDCRQFGDTISIVIRDRGVATPSQTGEYFRDAC